MKKQPDYTLFFIVVLLIGIGVSMIYSASADIGSTRFADEKFFLKRQITGSIISILLIIFLSFVNSKVLEKLAFPLMIFSLISCILVFIPGLGVKLRSTSNINRWLNLRLFIFQPSEIAKIAVIINLARILTKKKEKINDFISGFAWPLTMVVAFFLLILIQPDFTTAVFIVLVSVVMFYAAGVSVRHLIMLSVVGFPIIALLIGVAGYRLKRIFAFVSRTSDSLGAGYQITESLKSFNRGGFFGIGIGRGTKILPEPFTDFIFSVYGEEAGFLGSLIIIILFAFLAYRGIKIAYKTNDNFLSLLAFGFTFLLISQAAINIMVTIGLLPTTGITLPFLSYGRSSLLVSSAMIGVLLNISRKSDNEA